MNELIAFIESKLADAERSVKARQQARETWAGGKEKDWRSVGCHLNKKQRLAVSTKEARIEIKCLREVELFKAVLDQLRTSPPPIGLKGENERTKQS